MTSARIVILEYVCPTLGCIMGNIMFSAPYRDVKKAVERGYLGDLNPTPWGFMLGNCLGWLAYSYIQQNLFIFFANAPGCVLSVWLNMCAVKIQYEDHRAQSMRKSFVSFLEQSRIANIQPDEEKEDDDVEIEDETNWQKAVDLGRLVVQVTSQQTPAPAAQEKLVVGMILVWLTTITVIMFGNYPGNTNQLICGILVNVNLLFFYGAPLSTIVQVWKHHSSASIHLPTMITNTANGSFWTAYGIAVMDPFIYVPNGIGALLGVIQFLLCLVFPRKPTDVPNEVEEGQPAVQLEGIPVKEGTLEEGLSSSQESEASVEEHLLRTTDEVVNANDTP